MCSGGSKTSGEIRWGRQSVTRGHKSTWPYSMGDTLISITFGELAMALDALYALVFMCPGPRSNANKISALSALVKLNLPPSKD